MMDNFIVEDFRVLEETRDNFLIARDGAFELAEH